MADLTLRGPRRESRARSERMRLLIGLAALCAVVASGGGTCASQTPPAGWIRLFDGRDMNGWTKVAEGDWTVEGGLLKYRGGGNGWLRTNEKFIDFQLIAEWRFPVATGDRDSGVFFRAREAKPWTDDGYQLNMGP